MKIKQEIDNGNVAAIRNPQILSQGNHESQWIISNSSTSLGVYDNANSIENYHSEHNRRNSIYQRKNLEDTANIKTDGNFYFENEDLVCNNQYSINRKNNINFDKGSKQSELENLEGATTILYSTQNNCFEGCNVSFASTPIDEEQVFDHSDTDEMSEEVIRQVPLGIVNPNYPGFQHLAHTLQDYSSRIENFYHSENDMTDDDVEITDLTEVESNQDAPTVQYKNNNNINDTHSSISTKDLSLKTDPCLFREKIDSNTTNEIPDLLKIASNINNNTYDTKLSPESNYTDIENNFHTGDIIGDFNKEIADEIKELLNYNINIQDDLKELRKDIKETFSKPIETTINNISDVVNHVIKKLVEIKSDEESENIETDTFFQNKYQIVPDISNIHIDDNEKIYKTEMAVSRPTFLVLESNINSKITDAFLSDGKDELKFYNGDYDTETLSNNVENTIKQLSTELRKIIPKLDEMREQDRLWATCKSDITTDSNFNEISIYSESRSNTSGISKINQSYDKNTVATTSAETSVAQFVKRKLETIVKIDQIKEKSSAQEIRKAQKQSSSVRRTETEDYDLESFDVYNIETALPKLDFDAIENHLRAAKEEERRKRNDREEIRRRLAMGVESDEFYSIGHTDRPGKKPSLHSRLQNGKNLQICFMNEAASDNESQTSELEKTLSSSNKSLSRSSIFSKSNYSLNNHPYQTRPLSVTISKHEKISTIQNGGKLRPTSLSNKPSKSRSTQSLGHIELKESDFHALQATLQTEARMALAQAKELARIQMERERAGRAVSPVTEMLRRSLEKACAPLAPDRRRLSRQLLTDMNVAQLQVIVNELHSQIELLNDSLVKLLMARDELHMSQDSMLVDIEDLTRYFGVKEQTKKTKGTGKSGVRRLTSFVNK